MTRTRLRTRLTPQFVLAMHCAILGHKQMRFSAWDNGTQVVVYTCRCGKHQDTKVLAANRRIRRHR